MSVRILVGAEKESCVFVEAGFVFVGADEHISCMRVPVGAVCVFVGSMKTPVFG